MIIEDDKPQSENDEESEQQRNQNEQSQQDKQPLDDLQVANKLLKAAEGSDEIPKDAIFLLNFYKFFKRAPEQHIA